MTSSTCCAFDSEKLGIGSGVSNNRGCIHSTDLKLGSCSASSLKTFADADRAEKREQVLVCCLQTLQNYTHCALPVQ